jgi:hypothetical protein
MMRTKMNGLLLLLTVALGIFMVWGSGCSRAPATRNETRPASTGLKLPDPEGNMVDPLQSNGTHATVFVFVSTDCPISNRYAPEIRRLHEKFAPRGIRFWLIYPGTAQPAEVIRRHLREYQYPCEALLDPRLELVKQTQVRVTPEAAVFVPGPKLAYYGRIDDRYVDFGKERPSPTQRDLHDVLTSITSNQPVTNAPMPGVGCYISE